jgi:hypothetical protein
MIGFGVRVEAEKAYLVVGLERITKVDYELNVVTEDIIDTLKIEIECKIGLYHENDNEDK